MDVALEQTAPPIVHFRRKIPHPLPHESGRNLWMAPNGIFMKLLETIKA
jgi:hypothetical protein